MTELRPCDVEAVLEGLEQTIAAEQRVAGAVLPKEVVEALDVVYHALVFAKVSDALGLWRVALWEGRLEDEAREAARAMLTYLNDAIARGETHRVSEICDCLEDIMSPSKPRTRAGSLAPGAGRAPVGA